MIGKSQGEAEIPLEKIIVALIFAPEYEGGMTEGLAYHRLSGKQLLALERAHFLVRLTAPAPWIERCMDYCWNGWSLQQRR
jgi:hypothetical protein